jgi:hypothetical protein
MDVSGLVLTVLGLSYQLTSTLYSYAAGVKNAKTEIKQLGTELFGLIGALEQVKRQQERLPSYAESEHFSSRSNLEPVLTQALALLQELIAGLETPASRVKAALQKLTWPLSASSTKNALDRLERVKTYFILSLLTDDLCVLLY